MSTKVVSIINFKGGVGKSTITFNLGGELRKQGKKVLLVDFDGQGNLTNFTGLEEKNLNQNLITSLNAIMDEQKDVPVTIKKTEIGLDIIPCNINKEKWVNDALSKIARETILKRFIDIVREKYDYDYILIDNAPSVNLDFQNSLVASDYYLIITKPEIASTDGISTIAKTINLIKEYFNKDLKSAGILINQAENRTNLHKNMKEYINMIFGEEFYIYNSVIPKSIAVGESQVVNIPICEYSKKSKIAIAFNEFTKEFLKVTK